MNVLGFPSDEEVIREETARFRALTPRDRIHYLRGLITAGALTMRRSTQGAFAENYALEQEMSARQALKEFIARHAG